MPQTTVWSYGSVNHPGTFNYPAFTIEATVDRPVRVKWINDLVTEVSGDFLPHLLPVDPDAALGEPAAAAPTVATCDRLLRVTPGPYTGPVPIVTHLHGGHSRAGERRLRRGLVPAGGEQHPGELRAPMGTLVRLLQDGILEDKFGVAWEPGTATFQYENDQRAATLWYHDHTLGMTRLNVYAGPGRLLPAPRRTRRPPGRRAPRARPGVGRPAGTILRDPDRDPGPLLQRRRLALLPATAATFFDGFAGPYIPDSDVPPIWNPEFFGNTMVVNGRTWPVLEVEPRRYRFRFLNGCNSRFLILKLVIDNRRDGSIDAALHRPVLPVLADRHRGRLPAGAGAASTSC